MSSLSAMKLQIDNDDAHTFLNYISNTHQTSVECWMKFDSQVARLFSEWALILHAIRPCTVKRIGYGRLTVVIIIMKPTNTCVSSLQPKA